MSKTREALEAALKYLSKYATCMGIAASQAGELEEKIKEALAEPDLRGIDAGNVAEWVHLREHGCISADELLIPVKSIPKYLAQNSGASPQPRGWQDLSEYEVSDLGVFQKEYKAISAALRAKNGVMI